MTVAERYLRGEYQSTIAEALGVDRSTISRDLAAIRRAWLASAVRDFDEAKAQEIAKIDAVEREAWAAWSRSTEDREVATQEEINDPITYTDAKGVPQTKNKTRRRATLRREGQTGAAVFLDVVLRCIAKRCEILGLDAPKRFVIDWDNVTEEQEDRLARGEPPEKVLTMSA